ncbi:hypothetical protein TNIN_191711 [Trichonephila inaurata madagascariensis]|uniref:Uncharacterized protein n=1 Tax=Trichonephila inaurata madagascariensis TaxID=2747483 RepID=A0A8X6K3F8_9ARAC|nr:hypothetical protein TNIN_191711 [Trichonephila inaurata madagascariensis]
MLCQRWRPKKMGERLLVPSYAPFRATILPFFWAQYRVYGSLNDACRGTGGVNVQMLRKTPRMKHVTTLRSLWPMDGTEADGAGMGHLKHAIGPFLPAAPIQQ